MTEEILKVLAFHSRLKILNSISMNPKSVTEILSEIKEIKNRESIFKSLKKLEHFNLVVHTYSEIKKADVYSSNFNQIIIDKQGNVIIK